MKKMIIGFSVLILSACSAKMMSFSKADVARGSKIFPKLTASELSEGKSLAEAHCVRCHELKPPSVSNEAGWRNIIPVMSSKVNRAEGVEAIGSKEQELLLKYYITMSSPESASK
jgi:hypothetical protein